MTIVVQLPRPACHDQVISSCFSQSDNATSHLDFHIRGRLGGQQSGTKMATSICDKRMYFWWNKKLESLLTVTMHYITKTLYFSASLLQIMNVLFIQSIFWLCLLAACCVLHGCLCRALFRSQWGKAIFILIILLFYFRLSLTPSRSK